MIHAAFVIVPTGGRFHATKRPDGRIGLPGGKLEQGEDAQQAVLREALEEGFQIQGPIRFHHTDLVEGKIVAWFTACRAIKPARYKEEGRSKRVVASGKTLARHGLGNEFLAAPDKLNNAW